MPRDKVVLGHTILSETSAVTFVRNGKRVVRIQDIYSADIDSVDIEGRQNIYKLRDWLNEHFPPES